MRPDLRSSLPLFALLLTACVFEAPPPTATSTATPTVPTAPPATLEPTPEPLATAQTRTPLPPLREAEWMRGADEAIVRLDVYCDFQSVGCAALWPLLDVLLQSHPDELRLIYHQYPLVAINDKAALAAEAAEVAGAQGMFWEFANVLYTRWSEWVSLPPGDFPAWLLERAGEAGLDVARFQQDVAGGTYAQIVEVARVRIEMAGLTAVPAVYLNSGLVQLDLTQNNLEAAIRIEALSAIQYESEPPMLIDPDASYVATLHLDVGEVVIELYPASAPYSVNSFVFLAREGWYDGTIFHRVLPGSLAETGDPSGTGLGGPGYFFPTELDPARRFDEAGVVAMSSAGFGVNGSQFFISLGPLPLFNGTRTVFGQVTSGLELLQALPRRDPLSDLLREPGATVLSITIEER